MSQAGNKMPPRRESNGGKVKPSTDNRSAKASRQNRDKRHESIRRSRVVPDLPEGGDVADFVALRPAEGRTDPEIKTEKLVESMPIDACTDVSKPSEGWPDANNTFRPFPLGVFPEPLRSFIVETAASLGCDTTFVAIPTICSVAGAIGLTRAIELKATWVERPIVWAAVVCRSGSLKSPAFDASLEPIRKAQAAATAKQRFLVSDVTIEALAVILERNPRGLLLARDELAAWIRGFDQYKRAKGADSAAWLELWRGGQLIIDRKTGDSPNIVVPHAGVSVNGTIQPGILAKALTNDDYESGFAARLLLAHPPQLLKTWSNRTISERTRSRYCSLVESLLALEHCDGELLEPLRLTLEPQARSEWEAWYNKISRKQADSESDQEAALLAKMEAYCARFALILQLAGDSKSTFVTTESMRGAIKLADWFAEETKRVHALLSEDTDQRENRELAEWIFSRGGSITARELSHGRRKFRNDSVAAEAALSALVQVGLGKWVEPPPNRGGGRPTRAFHLIYPVTDTKTGGTEGVTEGFGDGDTTLSA